MDIEHEIAIKILSNVIPIIYEAGLLDELSQDIKELIASNSDIAKLIASSDINLNPRLSIQEYEKYILKLFECRSNESEFYTTIIKICYIMMFVEKNPLVAQELRGVSNFNQALKEILR